QVWAHLEGEYGDEEMREKALAATRQLARRQLTWLRRWPNAEYIELKAGGRPPSALAAALGVRLRGLGERALS
ncbi:MAG: tRNA (adenosine(37)-N6)-dimethylallyltransferase MiaA, partial [Pseudomonadales bacterium]|nr:tRNA (adenosine(37)-N6)-dimethylallyltransferase MiaA [Pseudomonadales bacterium]